MVTTVTSVVIIKRRPITSSIISQEIKSTPDNSNLQGKSKKVRVIGSLSNIGTSKKIAGSKEKTVFTA